MVGTPWKRLPKNVLLKKLILGEVKRGVLQEILLPLQRLTMLGEQAVKVVGVPDQPVAMAAAELEIVLVSSVVKKVT